MLPFTYRRAPCKYCYANSLSALPIFICQRTLFFPISAARTLPLIGTDLENNVAKIRCAPSPKCIETYRSVLKCIVTYRSVSKRIEVYRNVLKCIETYRSVSKCIKVYRNVLKCIEVYRNAWIGMNAKQHSSAIQRSVVLLC